VLLLILESFGSTELLFILVMALVFFGPRKLPQLSRQLGKSMAEFRRASEDFKRTWEREVAMENPLADSSTSTLHPAEEALTEERMSSDPLPVPRIQAVSAEHTVARQSPITTSEEDRVTNAAELQSPEILPKRDWL
jgi:sec-independent protein translocase protein TatB